MKNYLMLFGVCFITACSSNSSSPTTEMALEKLKAKYANESSFVNIENIEKTDGVESEIYGVKIYQYSYKAKYRFLQDTYVKNDFKPGITLGTLSSPAQYELNQKDDIKLKKLGLYVDNTSSYQLVKTGTTGELQGKLKFEKTEKGWH